MRETLDYFLDNGVDAYLYVGSIEKSGYDILCDLLEVKNKAKSVLLYLVTAGGNPNAAYRIARALIHHYGVDGFRVAVPAECKSAGTLICMGAHSLVFFDRGELGPLDVQFQKQDEIFQQSSGLDILRGMTYLRQEALDTFNEYLLDINGGSGLSTKTASEIASNLVIGLFEPMFAQIDPIRLGEMNAALQIANEYGDRLAEKAKSLQSGALSKLIHNYPTHGFVIDRAEARKLFHRVDSPNEQESELSQWAMRLANSRAYRSQPKVTDLLKFFGEIFPKEKKGEAEPVQSNAGKDSADTGVEGSTSSNITSVAGPEQPPIEG